MSESRKPVRSFHDLHIFQEARSLAVRIYDLTSRDSFRKDFSLADQMRRAAVSIVSNIAEGFECGSRTEFARSLTIARGSCGELRAQALLSKDLRRISPDEFEQVDSKCCLISVGITRLIRPLRQAGGASDRASS
jgi:four helix bundle protein